MKLIFRKESTGFFDMKTRYHIFIEEKEKYLFSVEKDNFWTYIFSERKDVFSEKHKSYIGKIETNFSGTEFVVFNNGHSPEASKDLENSHKLMAFIRYENIKGPRRF
jgi:hypothetical protein